MSPETNPPSDARREDDELTQADAMDASASEGGSIPGQEDAPGEPAAAEEAPVPAEVADEPAAPDETPVPAEVAEEPAPIAEQPAQGAPEQPAAEAPAPAPEQPAAEAPAAEAPVVEELPEQPRQRPEIPGADLIPDFAPPEQDEFLDAEARAAAEAEAEARAAREREQEDQVAAEPIADAAIDLAAGARYSATGKRKSAVARVILKPGSGTYAINGKALEGYFPRETLQRLIRQPLETVGYDARMDVVARMHGGGSASQAGALRHGISRALIVADPHLRGELKRRGFLTRDPRVKERKKAGLKKARKRPQFSKR